MNRVTLVGRVTKDIELKTVGEGISNATFTVAVNRPFKNAQGNNESDFINVVVWRKQAENVARFVGKGSLVGVDGRIQTRNYEGTDGKRVYVTEVVADGVTFLDSKKDSEPGRKGYDQPNNAFANGGQAIEVDDSDLPF